MMYIWSGLQAKGAILKRKSITLVVLLMRKKIGIMEDKSIPTLSAAYVLQFKLWIKKKKKKEKDEN